MAAMSKKEMTEMEKQEVIRRAREAATEITFPENYMSHDEELYAFLSQEEIQGLKEMRSQDENLCQKYTDRFLVRFLFARKLDVKRALEMVRSHEEWRIKWDIDNMDAELLRPFADMGFMGWNPKTRDRKGRAVQFFYPRNCDLHMLKKEIEQVVANQAKQDELAELLDEAETLNELAVDSELASTASKKQSSHQARKHKKAKRKRKLRIRRRRKQKGEKDQKVPETPGLMHVMTWAGYVLSDMALDYDIANSAEGYVIVEDFRGASLLKNFNFPKEYDMKAMSDATENCIPARIRQILVLNPPWYMKILMKMVKPFFKSKLLSKIALVDDYEALQEYIAPEFLPVEMGGTLETDLRAFTHALLDQYDAEPGDGNRMRPVRTSIVGHPHQDTPSNSLKTTTVPVAAMAEPIST